MALTASLVGNRLIATEGHVCRRGERICQSAKDTRRFLFRRIGKTNSTPLREGSFHNLINIIVYEKNIPSSGQPTSGSVAFSDNRIEI